jgi:hypothetical protein
MAIEPQTDELVAFGRPHLLKDPKKSSMVDVVVVRAYYQSALEPG